MAKEKERVVESRLGRVTVATEGILRFPRGLIGFESRKAFTLIKVREDSPFMILQSLDDPKLGLLVTDPYCFMTGYEVVVGEAERRILKVEDVSDLAILVTVSIPPGCPERTTLNLSGPIVLNTKKKIGVQSPQADTGFPAHFIPGMTPVPQKSTSPATASGGAGEGATVASDERQETS